MTGKIVDNIILLENAKKMNLEREFEFFKQGAESRLYKGIYLGKCVIVKERFKKNYRHADLDKHLTKERMKAEARAIMRCKLAGIRTPALYLVDFERQRIYMEDIEKSVTLKDYITQLCGDSDMWMKLNPVANETGRVVGKLHANNIIHGDLTTSNMLYLPDNTTLVLIDFGLSHVNWSTEDKAVDLYVLERALISTHVQVEQLFATILDAYENENNQQSAEVLKKLDQVRARGRKRTMVG